MKTNCPSVLAAAAAILLMTGTPLARASETDARIESAARNSYVFQTFLMDDAIKTQSQDGVVTLSGTVKQEFHKELALDTVSHLPGVRRVDNQLEIKGISAGMTADDLLSMKVMMAIWVHRQTGDKKPRVDVKNGVALLQGEVTYENQLARVSEIARDVEGIKGVRNEMTVIKIQGEPAQTPQEKIDDASVTAQVMAALQAHRSTRTIKTSVETKDGVVTLGGKAQNTAEKDLATKLVRDIYGVRSVTNNMTL